MLLLNDSSLIKNGNQNQQILTVWEGSFQVVLEVKNPPANEGDTRDVGSTPG